MALDLDQGGRIPQNVSTYLGPTLGWRYTDAPTDIEYVMSRADGPISPGYKGVLTIPEWVVVQSWVLLADVACTAQIDIWRVPLTTYLASGPPTVANSLCGSQLPALTAQAAAQSTAINTWVQDTQQSGVGCLIYQNDVLAYNLNTNNLATKLTLTLKCVRIVGTG